MYTVVWITSTNIRLCSVIICCEGLCKTAKNPHKYGRSQVVRISMEAQIITISEIGLKLNIFIDRFPWKIMWPNSVLYTAVRCSHAHITAKCGNYTMHAVVHRGAIHFQLKCWKNIWCPSKCFNKMVHVWFLSCFGALETHSNKCQ